MLGHQGETELAILCCLVSRFIVLWLPDLHSKLYPSRSDILVEDSNAYGTLYQWVVELDDGPRDILVVGYGPSWT